jgi:hypothetical protein
MDFQNIKESIPNFNKSYYEFLLKNDLVLYDITKESSWHNLYAFISKKYIESSNFSTHYANSYPIDIMQLKENFIISNINVIILGDDQDINKKDSDYQLTIKKNFLLSFVNDENFDKFNQEFYFYMDYFFPASKREKYFNDFLKNADLFNENKLKFIKKLKTSFYYMGVVNFSILEDILAQSKLSKKQQDDFYFSFIQSRKNQLKGMNAEKVKNFLIQRYGKNEENLKPYFSFISTIKNLFQPFDLDIFIDKKMIFSFVIDYHKANNIFNNRQDWEIKTWVENFFKSYGEYFFLLPEIINYHNSKKENWLEFAFYSTEQSLSNCQYSDFYKNPISFKQHFITLLKDFLIIQNQSKPHEMLDAKIFIQKKMLETDIGLSKNKKEAPTIKI